MMHGDDADIGRTNGAAQRRLADELLDELTAMKPRDRTRMFHAWHQGGVSIVQLSAVNLLTVEGPMSMGRLADALGISVASATGVVDRMEDRGLVVRRHDAARPTARHRARRRGASDLFRTLEQTRREQLSRCLLDQLSESELEGFLIGLRALRAARERLRAEAASMIGLLRAYLRPYRRECWPGPRDAAHPGHRHALPAQPERGHHRQWHHTGDTQYIIQTGALMLVVACCLAIASILAVYWGARVAMGFGRDVRAAIFTKVESFSQVEVNRLRSAVAHHPQHERRPAGPDGRVHGPHGHRPGADDDHRRHHPRGPRGRPASSLLMLVILPLMGLVIGLTMARAIPLFQAMQKKIDRINQVMRETLSGVRVIRAFVRTEHEEQRFDTANLDLFGSAIRVNRLFAITIPVMTVIMNLSTVAVMWFGGQRVGLGDLEHRQPDRVPPVPAAHHVLGADRDPDVHPRAQGSRLIRTHRRGPGHRADHP